MIAVTKKEFKVFEIEVRRMIDFLGLHVWDLDIKFEKLGNEEYAEARWHIDGMEATIALSTKTNRKKSKKYDIETAQHEVFHLLLAKCHSYAMRRVILDDQVTNAIHEVIQILINRDVFNK